MRWEKTLFSKSKDEHDCLIISGELCGHVEMALSLGTSGQHRTRPRTPSVPWWEPHRAGVRVCARVGVFDQEKGAGVHVWMAGLYLQEIIIFIVLYIKLSSTSLQKKSYFGPNKTKGTWPQATGRAHSLELVLFLVVRLMEEQVEKWELVLWSLNSWILISPLAFCTFKRCWANNPRLGGGSNFNLHKK